MSTITIRLPDELKARVPRGEEAGTTSQAFILEAITEKVDLAEQSAGFHDEAERRFVRIVETGETIDWDEGRTYLMDRLRGQ
ncbi:CopG family transcriptional regulator [Luteimonas sp. RD2P54]|uniref:CopG family transcriptional regulator n=1 Tax=Luteimonas endophytica TaxID=3042023 RepID=A0ABT6J532_9GAMM|nr:CopG family transcriptional regulator [Luteimonas endophytica]MDH5821720.1 CopG family transcriptional regulator [Luteimonas endophytica]